ncbi:MAG: hypothetical protein RM338_06095 [Nostoc sp. DedQUE12a]|nr:hypothetical protein [Nostoc sp. DedQUE12a]
MKLFYTPNSPYARIARVTALELNTCRLRGKGERKNLYPLPFTLCPKPNSEFKMQNPSSIALELNLGDRIEMQKVTVRDPI